MLKQKYFLTDFFILSAEKQPIKLSWRNIEWLQKGDASNKHPPSCCSYKLFTTCTFVPYLSKTNWKQFLCKYIAALYIGYYIAFVHHSPLLGANLYNAPRKSCINLFIFTPRCRNITKYLIMLIFAADKWS